MATQCDSEINVSDEIDKLKNRLSSLKITCGSIESECYKTAREIGEYKFNVDVTSSMKNTLMYKNIFDEFKDNNSCISIQSYFDDSPSKELVNELKEKLKDIYTEEDSIERLIELEEVFNGYEQDFYDMFKVFNKLPDVLLLTCPCLSEIDVELIDILRKYIKI